VSSDIFELFWSGYPRRIGKAKAREAFTRALRKTTLDIMLTALEWQREQASWQDRDADGVLRYVPHPASWLNGERWDDEKPTKRNTLAVVQFKPQSCGQCIEGWTENELRQAVRCACRQVKARTA
jgi:hypothetical protein